jgi:1,4-alpha-glucan branching enzyme
VIFLDFCGHGFVVLRSMRLMLLFAKGIEKFSRGYQLFGFNRAVVNGVHGILYKEWVPAATCVFLIGDFSMSSRHCCGGVDAFL